MNDKHTDVTERLLSLAARRFGKKRGDLSPSDDLFDALGIDSVEAMTLLSAIEQELRVEVPDYEVQDVRTFADLAAVIARRA